MATRHRSFHGPVRNISRHLGVDFPRFMIEPREQRREWHYSSRGEGPRSYQPAKAPSAQQDGRRLVGSNAIGANVILLALGASKIHCFLQLIVLAATRRRICIWRQDFLPLNKLCHVSRPHVLDVGGGAGWNILRRRKLRFHLVSISFERKEAHKCRSRFEDAKEMSQLRIHMEKVN